MYTRDHARCEKRRGRDAYVWTKRVFLNAKSSIELRKKCRGALTSSRFSRHQKRDEISEKTPTFQGRQKMIKCVLSSLKDLARMKERESTSLFLPLRPLSFSRKLGFPRRTRDRRREEEHIIIIRKRRSDLFFFFFFLSDCSNVFDSIFLSLVPNTYVI